MIVGSILENISMEKRISITPDIVKRYLSLGIEIQISENYGDHLGIKNKEYLDLGAKILRDDNEILSNADIIVQLSLLDESKYSIIREKQNLIGILNPYSNKEKLEKLTKKKNKFIFFRIITKNNESSINGYFVVPSKSSRLQGSFRVFCYVRESCTNDDDCCWNCTCS